MQLTKSALRISWEPQKLLAQMFDYAISWDYKPLSQMLIEQFSQPTGWFGWVLGHTMSLEHKMVTDWTISLMDIRQSDRILDVGCGGGMAIQSLSQLANKGFVAGIDYSTTMVQQAIKRNWKTVETGRVAIQHGNVAHLPYPDESFDKVCAIETFYFWSDPIAYLQEVRRVLKPGGRIAISMEFSQESIKVQENLTVAAKLDTPLYSGADMIQMLTTAGFKDVSFEANPYMAHGWLYAQGMK